MGLKINISPLKTNLTLREFLTITAEVKFGPNMDEVTGERRKLHNECHNLQTLY